MPSSQRTVSPFLYLLAIGSLIFLVLSITVIDTRRRGINFQPIIGLSPDRSRIPREFASRDEERIELVYAIESVPSIVLDREIICNVPKHLAVFSLSPKGLKLLRAPMKMRETGTIRDSAKKELDLFSNKKLKPSVKILHAKLLKACSFNLSYHKNSTSPRVSSQTRPMLISVRKRGEKVFGSFNVVFREFPADFQPFSFSEN